MTMDGNERAQKAYKNAGFKPAGVYRQGAFVKGTFRDFVIMDILKEEFFETYPPGTSIGNSP